MTTLDEPSDACSTANAAYEPPLPPTNGVFEVKRAETGDDASLSQEPPRPGAAIIFTPLAIRRR